MKIEAFVSAVRPLWGPLSTELVSEAQRRLAELASTSATEPWLAALSREPVVDAELHRDPEHGFLLLAHGEQEGRYRVPHDHGAGWVVYAVQRGEMEMGTYAVVDGRLVRRDVSRVRAGECRVYLPGDIHDTRCISSDVLMLRFTSCDLKVEDREGRMKRFSPAR